MLKYTKTTKFSKTSFPKKLKKEREREKKRRFFYQILGGGDVFFAKSGSQHIHVYFCSAPSAGKSRG